MASVEHCLFCFETLVADLEGRSAMSLPQVVDSWTQYPKGLEDGEEMDDEGQADNADEGADALVSSSKRPKLDLTIQRLAVPRTDRAGASTPSTTSTASSASTNVPSPSTAATTPASSTPSFVPIGIGRHTSQRSASITESPLFITWTKASSSTGHYNLRGCIGTFEALSLAEGLSQYALIAALNDVRFSPVAKSELPRLQVGVTLLTDFEPCQDPMDWEVGVHGLRISFYHHHRRFGSTYLPDVAVEQGWTKEECLVSLMRKAGWSGRKEKWREVGDLKVTRYQGKVENVEYEEYRRWRDWVDARDAKEKA
ncbi:MAG: hypothetical protein M1818_000669 [Claussenomyces sp. TS43310]|nr:MAG: hypothetical protein M1818_000669 [Claussenomyces sp. TS43310]